MIKIFLLLFNCILIIGCGSSIPYTQYFGKMNAEEIEGIDEDTLTFRISYIDNMFKSLGRVSKPNIPFDIKYDTLSRYTVIVGGNIFFSNVQEENVSDIQNDSIELSYVIVKKEGKKAKLFSNKKYRKSVVFKPMKDCPIPFSIMKEIRKDFFIRMKYQKYYGIDSDSLKGITVMQQYQLF